MPEGKTKASSGWTELPEAQLTAYPADPSFPSRVRSVIRRIEQQIDYIRGTVSGVSEWQANLTATLPLAVTSNVVSLTGLSTVGASNQIVGVNTPGTAWQYWTLGGTANQVTVAFVAGPTIRLSGPQDLASTSSPTFTGLNIMGLTGNRLLATNLTKDLTSVANLASWIAGTANRVTVADDSDGTITLSLPQDFHTAASPTFAGLTISGTTASRLIATDGAKALTSVTNLASWIAGTANRVTVADDSDGTITLSLPQDFHTGASPTFAGLTVSGTTASRLVATDGAKALTSVANLASWIAGTANRVTVADDSDGTITLSLPQDFHTGASPTFAGLTITGGLASFSNAAIGYASIHIGSMAGSPTSPTAGDVWLDTTYGTFVERLAGKNTYRSGVLCTIIGTGTVSGTAVETSLLSGVPAAGTLVLPANFLTAGKTLRFYFAGLFDTKAAPVGTLTLRVESTNHASLITFGPFTPAASISNGGWELTALMTCRTTGVGGTVAIVATLEFIDGVMGRTVFASNPTTAWNTTTEEIFDITAEWAISDASNTIDLAVTTLEVLL